MLVSTLLFYVVARENRGMEPIGGRRSDRNFPGDRSCLFQCRHRQAFARPLVSAGHRRTVVHTDDDLAPRPNNAGPSNQVDSAILRKSSKDSLCKKADPDIGTGHFFHRQSRRPTASFSSQLTPKPGRAFPDLFFCTFFTLEIPRMPS
jgi:hypothetical protein